MTEQPVRHTVDTITDDDLDQLYARIATLEHVAAGNKRHVQLIVPDLQAALARAEQAEHERDTACRAFNTVTLRLDDAEAAIARVRALAEQLASEEHLAAAYADAARRIRTALDERKEPRP